MELYIRIKDGQPFEHPIFGDNFRQAFPEIDTNNLPEEFARFERVAAPTLGAYEVHVGVHYQRFSDVIKDVWTVRDMTAEEKAAKQQAVQDAWAALPNRDNFTTWVFDAATCSYQPPVPMPTEGRYRWDGATNSWVSLT